MQNLELITIIDDNPEVAAQSKYIIEDLDCEALVISQGPYNSVEQLLIDIRTKSQGKRFGVLCDHRLTNGAFANFYGSELVASLYKAKIPSILSTMFSNTDISTTIREYRRWTPVLLGRNELNINTLPQGFDRCLAEIEGKIPASRIPHRTLIEIMDLSRDGDIEVVDALISSWKDEVVRFPMSLIDNRVQAIMRHNMAKQNFCFLFCETNTGASSQVDLFFSNFEEAIDPEESFNLF